MPRHAIPRSRRAPRAPRSVRRRVRPALLTLGLAGAVTAGFVSVGATAGATPTGPARVAATHNASHAVQLSGRPSRPDLSGYPNASNTGVPARIHHLRSVPNEVRRGRGWHWDPRGWVVITRDGTTFEGYRVTRGGVEVYARNVRVRDNDIQNDGNGWAVGLRPGSSHVVVAHNTVHGPCLRCADRLAYGVNADLEGDTRTDKIIANDIYHVDHPVQIETGLVAGNYVHAMATVPGDTDHVDCLFSGGGERGRLWIRHNTLLNDFTGDGSTSSIMLNNAFGGQTNRLIEDNLIAGGGYTLYGGQGGPGASNVVVRDNKFSTAYFRRSGYYGAVIYLGPRRSGNVFANNRWADGPHRGQLVRR